MVLIHGLFESNSPNNRELSVRSKVLLQQIERDKQTLILSAVTVSEFLVGISAERMPSVSAEIHKRFIVAPFDSVAANIAADLWQRHSKLKASEQTKRRLLKADALIVASAKSAGCQVFYSHDKKCRRLADLANMESRDLPTHSENLFDN